MKRFADKMQEHRDVVVKLLMWEIGKNQTDSEKEFDRTVKYIYDTIDEYKNIDKNLTDSNVGGRKGRGIRDNLYVINAITNSVRNGGEDSCDIQVFDVEKCFDSLWVQECVNTLYEYGFKNDKLVLLYEETKNAKIAIKTPNGTTNRENIQNIIMQGTVFGSLICTAVMDKLAQIFYENQDLVYKYKDKVESFHSLSHQFGSCYLPNFNSLTTCGAALHPS